MWLYADTNFGKEIHNSNIHLLGEAAILPFYHILDWIVYPPDIGCVRSNTLLWFEMYFSPLNLFIIWQIEKTNMLLTQMANIATICDSSIWQKDVLQTFLPFNETDLLVPSLYSAPHTIQNCIIQMFGLSRREILFQF